MTPTIALSATMTKIAIESTHSPKANEITAATIRMMTR
jgi:hypothetical protein